MLACDREIFDWNDAMRSLKAKLGILAAGLMLSGCMQATTYQAAPEATLKPADKTQLAKARYQKVAVAEPFRRAIVDYHRREQPRTIVVDSDNHYLYLVRSEEHTSELQSHL